MYSYRFKNTGGADTHPAGDEPKSHRIHTGTVDSPGVFLQSAPSTVVSPRDRWLCVLRGGLLNVNES